MPVPEQSTGQQAGGGMPPGEETCRSVAARTWHFLLGGMEREPWVALDTGARIGCKVEAKKTIRRNTFCLFDRMCSQI